MSTPTCDVTMYKMVVPYSSNVCENSLIQWNVWIHRLPRENVSTMSPALVGRNFSSVDILLTFTLSQCNVMTLLNNLSGTGAWLHEMEYFDVNRFLSVQIQMILVYKKYIFCEEKSSVLTPWLPIYPCVHAIRCPFLYMFHSEKNLNLIKCVFVSDYWNDCIDDILLLCNLLEKHFMTFIISWHCSLGDNFLADTFLCLSWPALSRSWHLAASEMGLGVMSHQAGLLTTLHHIHICFPEQGGNRPVSQ